MRRGRRTSSRRADGRPPARGARSPTDAPPTTSRERDAMSIERAADDVALAFLLEQRLFQEGWETEFRGEVVSVIGAGAFVAFEGFEGLLPVRRLPGWYELNELETMLVGEPRI